MQGSARVGTLPMFPPTTGSGSHRMCAASGWFAEHVVPQKQAGVQLGGYCIGALGQVGLFIDIHQEIPGLAVEVSTQLVDQIRTDVRARLVGDTLTR